MKKTETKITVGSKADDMHIARIQSFDTRG